MMSHRLKPGQGMTESAKPGIMPHASGRFGILEPEEESALPPKKEEEDYEPWAATVISWGKEPLLNGMTCRPYGWKTGMACGRCKRCGQSRDRPSDGADVEKLLYLIRKSRRKKS